MATSAAPALVGNTSTTNNKNNNSNNANNSNSNTTGGGNRTIGLIQSLSGNRLPRVPDKPRNDNPLHHHQASTGIEITTELHQAPVEPSKPSRAGGLFRALLFPGNHLRNHSPNRNDVHKKNKKKNEHQTLSSGKPQQQQQQQQEEQQQHQHHNYHDNQYHDKDDDSSETNPQTPRLELVETDTSTPKASANTTGTTTGKTNPPTTTTTTTKQHSMDTPAINTGRVTRITALVTRKQPNNSTTPNTTTNNNNNRRRGLTNINNNTTPTTLTSSSITTTTTAIPDQRELVIVPPLNKKDLFHWQDQMEEAAKRSALQQKQLIKERDGFCRRVDHYDGQVIYVEDKAAYELGNYLGGGVAGVVYEGHRLLPMEEYPVRTGAAAINQLSHPSFFFPISGGGGEDDPTHASHNQHHHNMNNNNSLTGKDTMADDASFISSLLCIPTAQDVMQPPNHNRTNTSTGGHTGMEMENRDTSLLTLDSGLVTSNTMANPGITTTITTAAVPTSVMVNPLQQQQQQQQYIHRPAVAEDIAVEATDAISTINHQNIVIIDKIDAPSRSKHFAKAVTNAESEWASSSSVSCDLSLTTGMQETVAIKILNPVGFRTLAASVTQTAVVARSGDPFEAGIAEGKRPMEERHVWWLVNPNSRNLRTLQRYNKDPPRTVQVDRGSAEKGLRISLIAAYQDPETRQIRELPLNRCIEIWGHVPFGASDAEFAQIMQAIDRVNQGLSPQQQPPALIKLDEEENFGGDDDVGDDDDDDENNHSRNRNRHGSSTTRASTLSSSMNGSAGVSMESLRISGPSPIHAKRTGIYRAAHSERKTVYCEELRAYIAIPATPSKYLKWLRQRRAATKEIRNMMRIGRHRNVVHLFEVLEWIQENKSTMFLVLELVRGGELFDLISSNSAKISHTDKIPQGFSESETVMRKFFRELASGIHYCHSNGIAHRDLKPENLLVHNSRSGDCILKIADFGLSAAFGPNSQSQMDQETMVESLISFSEPPNYSHLNQGEKGYTNAAQSQTAPSPVKLQMERFLAAAGSAASFFTCGAVADIITCSPRVGSVDFGPSPLKRMTSVVGSPHYVAPEIIAQSDLKRPGDASPNENGGSPPPDGYDGTKADVWSAGVILYAMLFRSLPFGEDLLRCPRFQSYRKWYDEVKKHGSNRRSSVMGALNPVITDVEDRDFLGPHWFFPSKTSRESRDLIVYMLNPDPDMRPTIQLVLQHPWLLKKAS